MTHPAAGTAAFPFPPGKSIKQYYKECFRIRGGILTQPIRSHFIILTRTNNSGYLRDQPWRCLCFGFSQMIRILPFLLMTLHFSQIGFTEDLTFMMNPPFLSLTLNFPYVYGVFGGLVKNPRTKVRFIV